MTQVRDSGGSRREARTHGQILDVVGRLRQQHFVMNGAHGMRKKGHNKAFSLNA